jgi:anti-sigma28 factor (negative regulator of flagellin synthesis)
MLEFKERVKILDKEVAKMKYHSTDFDKIKFVTLREYIESKELAIDE